MPLEFPMFAVSLRHSAAWSLSRSATAPEGRLILFTLLAIALAWIALHLWDRHRARTATHPSNPAGLFEALCAAHGLAPNERDALRGIVVARRLSHPAVVFVDPRHLRETAGGNGPASASAEALRQRLFGEGA